ncbi:hypothetical protein ACT6NV_06435 [Robiginitalea sp. IMCC44478]|uniref:hypothetical protein n=1 Tax=Robiginitalea sp. IMCC44478 TaxID=3459122 RepID=UPI004041156B
MKKYACAFLLAFGLGILTAYAQNWKITQSDNSIILIGEGWVKLLPGSGEYKSDEEYPGDGEDEYGEEQYVMMYNTAENLIVMIDEANQTYARGTVKDYCNALKSMQQGMDATMLQQMIADQKAMPAPKIVVSKEKGDPILGYATVKYTLESDTGFFEDKWITNDPRLNDIVSVFKEWLKFQSEVVSCSLPDASFLKGVPELSETYKEVQASGFELMSFQYDSEGTESSSEVINIEKGVVAPSEFDIPEGYTKRSFQEFLMTM